MHGRRRCATGSARGPNRSATTATYTCQATLDPNAASITDRSRVMPEDDTIASRQPHELPTPDTLSAVDSRTFTALREAAAGERVAIVVRGRCMEPHLPAGEAVEVRARRVYLPGDVIVFRTPTGPLAIHRVLGWRPAGLVTRGDHCAEHDAPVRREAIVGAVCMRVGALDRLRALLHLLGIAGRRMAR